MQFHHFWSIFTSTNDDNYSKMFPMHFMPLDFLLFNIKNQYKRIYGVCVILMIFLKLLITFTAHIQYKIKSDIVHTCIYDIHVLHSLKYIRSIIPIIVGILNSY